MSAISAAVRTWLFLAAWPLLFEQAESSNRGGGFGRKRHFVNRHSLYFLGPGRVALQEEAFPSPGRQELLVKTLYSAISPGTEMLVYQGMFPEQLQVDETISTLVNEFRYPLKYGYAAVGRVIAAGPDIDSDRKEWIGRTVFAFNPHENYFLASPADLIPIPPGVRLEDAVFLPNMETAVNLVMDGAPLLGERVVVLGQGIVGLLTTAILAQFPLDGLLTLDRYPLRRRVSLKLGAKSSLDPREIDFTSQVDPRLGWTPGGGADLTYELTGSPAALEQAIALTGFAGRVIIGSWYGKKRGDIDLGGWFHRSRIHLISSQVSTLAPHLGGRWTKKRRFATAWEMIRRLRPSALITHRFPFTQAASAYELLDQRPEEAVQVLFTYSD